MNILKEPTRRTGKFFVYALCEPITHEIRYIGVTGTPYGRMMAHLSEAKRHPLFDSRCKWLSKLLKKNMVPEFVILEVTTFQQRHECEQKWQRHYENGGAILLNTDKRWRKATV